ncbi:MAG: cell wall-binding repeat-containing protein, partial [Eggerthellaceae bacterium]|nr:cell wall-binding repeat-containing protein [Eggerthellaceae bacterium]
MTTTETHNSKPISRAFALACAIAAIIIAAFAAAPAYADDTPLTAGAISFESQGDALTTQASPTWTRLYGDNALDTMAEISKKGFSSSDVAVVATMSGYWDALAASSLAGAYKAPILLTDGATLSSQTSAELDRLKAKNVFIVGGTMAVSDKVAKQLKAKGLTVKRLSGDTAVETATEVADYVKGLGKTGNRCIVATIDSYHDALAIAPYAYANGAPIFLTNFGGKSISSGTVKAIKAGGYANATIVGGTLAVSNAVKSQLSSAGVGSVNRLGGTDAYDTARVIAKWEIGQDMKADNMGIACGTGYWDALAGAALCGKNNAVILLADNSNYRSAVITINEWRSKISTGYVFGGSQAVQDRAYDSIDRGVTDTVYDGLSEKTLGSFTKIGIDVSYWNGDIDWNKVHEAGVDYAIIRCGYGDDYSDQDDARFIQNVKGARAAGVEIGVYLYSYASSVSQAQSEAAHTVRLLRAAGLSGSDVPYGVYYDLEESSVGSVANRTLLASMSRTYCSAIKAAGYRPGVYANLWWWNTYLTDSAFNSWSRWVAQWSTSCTYMGTYDMWQCTS